VIPVQELSHRRCGDVEADLVHARAAREAAVRRHDIESATGLSARIDQLSAELAGLLPAPRGVCQQPRRPS
jgi:hypothetical protein